MCNLVVQERLDFSCALFGPDGGLVCNAPHIPVHLGAMQEAVQYQVIALHCNMKVILFFMWVLVEPCIYCFLVPVAHLLKINYNVQPLSREAMPLCVGLQLTLSTRLFVTSALPRSSRVGSKSLTLPSKAFYVAPEVSWVQHDAAKAQQCSCL